MKTYVYIALILACTIKLEGQVTISTLNRNLFTNLSETFKSKISRDSIYKIQDAFLQDWKIKNKAIIIDESIRQKLISKIDRIGVKQTQCILFFTYDNCPPCKPMLHILKTHHLINKNEINLIVIDHTVNKIGLDNQIENYFGITAFPTIIMLDSSLSTQLSIIYGGSNNNEENRKIIETKLFETKDNHNSM